MNSARLYSLYAGYIPVKSIIGAFAHMQLIGVVDGTEDWETAEAEGPPAKHHIYLLACKVKVREQIRFICNAPGLKGMGDDILIGLIPVTPKTHR